MNQVILIGRLGKDPETKTLTTNTVTNFTVATSESYKNKEGEKVEKTEWHNIVAWGKTGETIAQYAKKGDQIMVQGRLQTRSWETEEGKKAYATEILVDSFEFLGSKKGGAQTETTQVANAEKNAKNYMDKTSGQQTVGAHETNATTHNNTFVDDLPF